MDLRNVKTKELKRELISKGLLADCTYELDQMIEYTKRGFKVDIKRHYNNLYIIKVWNDWIK